MRNFPFSGTFPFALQPNAVPTFLADTSGQELTFNLFDCRNQRLFSQLILGGGGGVRRGGGDKVHMPGLAVTTGKTIPASQYPVRKT